MKKKQYQQFCNVRYLQLTIYCMLQFNRPRNCTLLPLEAIIHPIKNRFTNFVQLSLLQIKRYIVELPLQSYTVFSYHIDRRGLGYAQNLPNQHDSTPMLNSDVPQSVILIIRGNFKSTNISPNQIPRIISEHLFPLKSS